MPPTPDHPAQLFTDAELEPVSITRKRIEDGIEWRAYCPTCRAVLASHKSKDEARRAGLAEVGGHVCVGPGELPENY